MAQFTGALSGRTGKVALALILAAHLVLCVAARPGFLASDDLFYAGYANDLADGFFAIERNHFANRLGLIAPTALSYAIFGVSEVSSVLWPLLCSLLAIVLVFFTTRALAGGAAAVLAAALVGLGPAQISSSLLLLPDGPTGTLLLAAAASLLAARRAFGGGRRFALAALTAVLIASAFLTKMTAVWIVPFLVVLGLRDVLRGRHRDLWAAAFSLLLLLGVGYLLAYRAWTGDILYRLHVIEAGHNQSDWTYIGQGGGALLARLVWEPAVMLLRHPELGIPILLAVPAAIQGLRRGAGDHGRWAVYFFALILSYWLLPTSLTAWNPLPVIPRMLLPVLPAAAILAAFTVTETRHSTSQAVAVSALLFTAAGAAAGLGSVRAGGLFALTGIVIVALRRVRFAGAAAIAVVLPLAAMGVYSVVRGGVGETPAQAAEREIVRDHLRADRPAIICTEPVSASAIRFRLGFPEASRLRFITRVRGENSVPPMMYVNDERDRFRAGRGKAGLDIRSLAESQSYREVASRAGVTLYESP